MYIYVVRPSVRDRSLWRSKVDHKMERKQTVLTKKWSLVVIFVRWSLDESLHTVPVTRLGIVEIGPRKSSEIN